MNFSNPNIADLLLRAKKVNIPTEKEETVTDGKLTTREYYKILGVDNTITEVTINESIVTIADEVTKIDTQVAVLQEQKANLLAKK